ncbi:MAG TPA: cell envelope integrity protein TolA [Steroidobacteraceae bacterium]|nr:cell envelope integrity protein TolA [Steroidobacteraceae bacterium]
MAGFFRENSRPVLYSVMLHGALAAALVYLALSPRQSSTGEQSAPINATVVDSSVLRTAQREQAQQAAERARAAAEAQAAAKAAAEAQAAAATKAAQEAQAQRDAKAAEQAKQAEATQQAAQAQAQAARAAEAAKREADARAAAEQAKRQAELKAAADAKAAAQAKAAAEAKAAADAKAAAERDRSERLADLRQDLASEEHYDAVASSPLADRYRASLQNRIQQAWIRPPSARVGIDCLVEVTQVPGGEVTSARVTQCNGDAAVRQSIENAVYRASPLPEPPDPALFQRNFAFRFKPDE